MTIFSDQCVRIYAPGQHFYKKSRHLQAGDCEYFVTPLPYIPHMSTKRRRRSIKLLVCPSCLQIGALRAIVYGMPDPEIFDFEKFAVGGCCGSSDGIDPDVRCRQCEWEGFRDSME